MILGTYIYLWILFTNLDTENFHIETDGSTSINRTALSLAFLTCLMGYEGNWIHFGTKPFILELMVFSRSLELCFHYHS